MTEREHEGETRRGTAPTPSGASSTDPRRSPSTGARPIIIPVRSPNRGGRLARIRSSRPLRIAAVAATAIAVAVSATLVARRGDEGGGNAQAATTAGATARPSGAVSPTGDAGTTTPATPATAGARTSAATPRQTAAARTSGATPVTGSSAGALDTAREVSPPDAGESAVAVPAAEPAARALTDGEVQSGVRQAIAQYAMAISAEDVDRIGRVYPDIPAGERDAWGAFFRDVDALAARLDVRDVRRIGNDLAEASVSGTYAYKLQPGGRSVRKAITFRGSFTRDPYGVWHIAEVH